MVSTMMTHIRLKNRELNQKISEFADEDFDEAAEWTRRRVMAHFHHRVNIGEVGNWLREDLELILGKEPRRNLPPVTESVAFGPTEMEGQEQTIVIQSPKRGPQER